MPAVIPSGCPTDSVLPRGLQSPPPHASPLEDQEPLAYSCDLGKVSTPLGLSFLIWKQDPGTSGA